MKNGLKYTGHLFKTESKSILLNLGLKQVLYPY